MMDDEIIEQPATVEQAPLKLLFKRSDGSFVAEVNGNPFHIISDDDKSTKLLGDDYFARAQAEAAAMGEALGFEPPPPPEEPAPEVTAATPAQISAQLGLLGMTEDQRKAFLEAAAKLTV